MTKAQRGRLLAGFFAAGVVPGLVATGFSVWAWETWNRQEFKIADLLTVVSVAFTVATLCLATLAAVVAIMAYAWATQRPELLPTVVFPGSKPNSPVLVVESGKLIDVGNLRANVAIENKSKYSGRNPALRIGLSGISGLLTSSQDSRWSLEPAKGPVTTVQWDGGAENSIYGTWTRHLPPLDFAGAAVGSSQPTLHLEVVAEGYRDTTTVAIEIVSLRDWVSKNRNRMDALPPELKRLLELSREKPDGAA